jgi:hypothetical protein
MSCTQAIFSAFPVFSILMLSSRRVLRMVNRNFSHFYGKITHFGDKKGQKAKRAKRKPGHSPFLSCIQGVSPTKMTVSVRLTIRKPKPLPFPRVSAASTPAANNAGQRKPSPHEARIHAVNPRFRGNSQQKKNVRFFWAGSVQPKHFFHTPFFGDFRDPEQNL